MRCRKLKIRLNILKWSWALWSLPPVSSACPSLWKNFSQRRSLISHPPIKSHAKRTGPTLSAKRNWKFLRTFRNQFPHCGLLLFNLREIGMAIHGRKSTLVKRFLYKISIKIQNFQVERNKRSFLALFNGETIIILSCLTVFLSFCIFF